MSRRSGSDRLARLAAMFVMCLACIPLAGCWGLMMELVLPSLSWIPGVSSPKNADDSTSKSWASTGDVLHIAATAHLAGSNNTTWRSDVVLHSMGPGQAQVEVELLEHGRANNSPQSRSYTIPSGGCRSLGDILGNEFSFSGAASLRVTPTSGWVGATSRTFNLLEDGNPLGLPAGSTFGQFIPAVVPGYEIRSDQEGHLIQLTQSVSNTTGFRTNLGLLNTSSRTIVVDTRFANAAGVLLGTIATELRPYEYRQINRVLRQVTNADVDDARAVVSTATADAAFLAYASVVDNRTGDPVAMVAAKNPLAGPVYVAAAAHASGVGGTNWRTDVEIFNPESSAVTVTVELLRHGRNNSSPDSVERSIGPGESRRFDDVLETLFGFSGAAALRVTSSAGPVLVTSRTYNLLGEGNDLGLPGGSTFGQFISGWRAAEGVGPDDAGHLIQMTEAPAFRTNVNVLNTSGEETSVELTLHDSAGTVLGTVEKTLAPYEYRQINRIFRAVTAGSVEDGFAILRITDGQGPVLGLASVVDNSTGDPVAIPANILRGSPTVTAEGMAEAVSSALTAVTSDLNSSIETLGGIVSTIGTDGLLAIVGATAPGTVDVNGGILTFDVGDSHVDRNGNLLAGGATIDLSDFHISQTAITGTAGYNASSFTMNGAPLPIAELSVEADLAIEPDGSIKGTISLSGASKSLNANSVTGWAEFDTTICPDYPIDGRFTIIIDGDSYTVVITPACDGTWDEGAGDMVVIDFDDLDPDATVSDQYPEATFSGGPGYEITILPYSWSSPPNCIWSVDEGTTEGNLYVDFTNPVRDLSFVVFDAKPAGPFAQLQVFVDGNLAHELPIYGTGSEDDLITVDLTAYSGVTGIACLNLYDEDTLLWDDFKFKVEE